MGCELCGGGDLWIKTCLTPEGSRVLVCDPCHAEHARELTIVPGDRVVTARCDLCGAYGNPREFSGVRLGGRKGAYSGTCGACTEEEEPNPAVVSIGQQTLDMGTLYSCLDNESSNLPRGS